jgi:hypothetical protein
MVYQAEEGVLFSQMSIVSSTSYHLQHWVLQPLSTSTTSCSGSVRPVSQSHSFPRAHSTYPPIRIVARRLPNLILVLHVPMRSLVPPPPVRVGAGVPA